MTTTNWIALVDAMRKAGGLLADGEWHGYTAPADGDFYPARGRYILVRWKAPCVVVCHDDPHTCVQTAKLIEPAIGVQS